MYIFHSKYVVYHSNYVVCVHVVMSHTSSGIGTGTHHWSVVLSFVFGVASVVVVVNHTLRSSALDVVARVGSGVARSKESGVKVLSSSGSLL